MRRASSYRVFLTRNSEYHIRAFVCCGVRDRRSGQFVADHWALGQRLRQAFPDKTGKLQALNVPIVGEALQFVVGGQEHHTSPILAVEEREYVQLGRGMRGSAIEALLCRTPPHNPRDTY